MKKIDYNALGQITDGTWGNSTQLHPASGIKINAKLLGTNLISVSFITTVMFRTQAEHHYVKKQQSDEADSVINDYVKKLKSSYKAATGDSLKFDDGGEDESLEAVNHNKNMTITAIFRKTKMYVIT